ncbi:MAG TPA: hypothetical protein VKZ60_19990 [Chloroflexota bacterium]|jgi:hypothetical protein|nr:hypothetical protein [Chloroflexota bacterium]
MEEIAGVAVVPLIVGLVEVAKGAGLASRWAPLLAVGLGVAISVGYGVAAPGRLAPEAIAALGLRGLALGLAAAGLYSGTRALAHPGAPAPGEERPLGPRAS